LEGERGGKDLQIKPFPSGGGGKVTVFVRPRRHVGDGRKPQRVREEGKVVMGQQHERGAFGRRIE